MEFNADTRASEQSSGTGECSSSTAISGASAEPPVKGTTMPQAGAKGDNGRSSGSSSISSGRRTSHYSSVRGSSRDDNGSSGSNSSDARGFDNGAPQESGQPSVVVDENHPSVVVDENVPLVRAHASSGYRQPCGTWVFCLLVCFLWIAVTTIMLLLRFLPATAEGAGSRLWRDGAMAAMGFALFILAVMTLSCVVFYCVCVRRRADSVDSNGEPSA